MSNLELEYLAFIELSYQYQAAIRDNESLTVILDIKMRLDLIKEQYLNSLILSTKVVA